MLKRPLNSRFREQVLADKKTTTIRDNPWPVGVPIMLYNWSGAPYHSKQADVAPVIVESSRPIHITQLGDGTMNYAYKGDVGGRLLYETEGFASRAEMDAWFRAITKPGKTVTKSLMLFRRSNAQDVQSGSLSTHVIP